MAEQSGTIAGMAGVHVAHAIPGRLRLRLAEWVPAEDVVEAVNRLDGVRSAAWSPRTRGLLVLYGPGTTTANRILEAAHEAAAFEPPPVEVAVPSVAESPTLARAVAASAAELDRRVRTSTAGVLGLGGLIPMVLAVWALKEIAFGRTPPLTWSTALWYAHGLFRDYNTPSS